MTQGSRRVLVVDDSLFFRTALAEALQQDGWEVLEAEDGRSALAVAVRKLSHLDLVLLDIQMPEMDGFEVLRRLRNDARGRRVPVLAMTGTRPGLDQIDVLRSLGASGYVDKTLPLGELMSRIRLSLAGGAGEM